MQKFIVCIVVLFLAGLTRTSSAQERAGEKQDSDAELKKQIKEMRKDYDAQLKALQQRIKELEAKTGEKPKTEAGKRKTEAEEAIEREIEKALAEEKKTEKPPALAGIGRAFQTFNPDISVISDVLAQYRSTEDIEPDDGFLFRELEIGFSGSVDPYARADIFLGIHKDLPEPGAEEEHHEHAHDHYALHLEEGYLTLLTLPWDLQARGGKFRTKFGKVNTQHLHALPWINYPLYIQNYFGDEGMMSEGAELSWLVPNPWNLYSELSYEVFNNDVGAFAGHHGDDFVHLGHLKNFFDLNENSTVELGFSGAAGPSDEGHDKHWMAYEGVDLTFKWRPRREGLYRSVTWQTELLLSQKKLPYFLEHEEEEEEEEHEHHPDGWKTNRTWGMFTALDYQFARRWTLGGRFDFSEYPDFRDRHDIGGSAYLTFAQSEYCFWRLGYEYVGRNWRYLDRFGDEHKVMLQLNFGLGPHRAHQY